MFTTRPLALHDIRLLIGINESWKARLPQSQRAVQYRRGFDNRHLTSRTCHTECMMRMQNWVVLLWQACQARAACVMRTAPVRVGVHDLLEVLQRLLHKTGPVACMPARTEQTMHSRAPVAGTGPQYTACLAV